MPGLVLVTGGASGIGAETCRLLGDDGWDVVAADVVSAESVVSLDVTYEAAWDRVLEDAGPLTGLVNCAGIRTRSSIVDTELDDLERHLRVNAVAPGPVRTPMTTERLGNPEQAAWLDARVPMGRVAEPAEIAEVISFLLSEKASYITGEVLFTDGGWHGNA